MEIIGNVENIIPDYPKEVHPIYDIKLDTFDCCSSPYVNGQISLWELLQKIKYNLGNDITADIILTPKYIDNKRNKVYDKKKVTFPATCYNASFNKYKDLSNLTHIHNIMFLDIDDFKSKEETLEYKSMIIKKYDWILACSLSLSQIGLHIIAYVDEITNNNEFNDKYEYISEKYFEKRLDKSAKSLTRYAIIPFDYHIYINESPILLLLNNEFNRSSQGTRSSYITDSLNNKLVSCSNNEVFKYSIKGTRSGYIKSTCTDYSVKEEEIISTPYTFCGITSLKTPNKYSKRLKLKHEPSEDEFTDPNIPIYHREGLNVIELELYKYRHKKIFDGGRTSFIGAITAQVIVLNVDSPEQITQEIRKKVLNFILGVNNKYCSPPLSKSEVIKSVNANWKSYKLGELDVARYLKMKRSFWSKECTLSTNEKRKHTCKLNNEPIVAETKMKIENAIAELESGDTKITQKKVEKTSGLAISTVKNYWKLYKEQVKEINENKQKNPVRVKGTKVPKLVVPDNNKQSLDSVFDFVYSNFGDALTSINKESLVAQFTKLYNSLDEDQKKIVAMPLEELPFEHFFIQSSLHLKFWNLLNVVAEVS